MARQKSLGLGTAPVFLAGISTILGAILFLRFGFAVGTLGLMGVLLIILVGHIVTIPTAFALSEIATNQRVEGGGEYYIISRSFGLNIGATIGIALYFSQAISVAFYIIAFTEAFEPFFNWMHAAHGIDLPRQAISLPAMALLSILILTKGGNLGIKALYVVAGILFIALALFFAGSTEYSETTSSSIFSGSFRNMSSFFVVLAIIFPAFTGMTAGVGLSGDLKSPRKSIPLGTMAATFIGMVIYVFIVWKLNRSASPADMLDKQLIMSDIAIGGRWIIPIGLAASTISSAIGSVLVAPRTLQALGHDRTFPFKGMNRFLARGKQKNNEPFNASLITCLIAFVFVAMGSVNAVASIITMFFMLTYGSICLISFLNHFGSDPSYRPTFRSRWIISLLGFLACLWLMFKINTPYTVLAIAVMILLYFMISRYHKSRRGLQSIFKGALFQLNRRLQLYLQQSMDYRSGESWRPSVISISKETFQRDTVLFLLDWIAYKYGFGTYIHLIDGYFSSEKQEESQAILKKLIDKTEKKYKNIYIDTLISPSYTSAIAQSIQLPGISGMENNMVIFDFDKANPDNLKDVIENINMVRAGKNDVCILGASSKKANYKSGIHIWIQSYDFENSNLMILLGYIISGHPTWYKSPIKIFEITREDEIDKTRENLLELMKEGRIPITEKNITIIKKDENLSTHELINENSEEAGLTILGFRASHLKHEGMEFFTGYDKLGDVLFVNSHRQKTIS